MDSALIVMTAYALINLFVFLMYGHDKKKAVEKRWRTPEKTLLLGGAAGPWGAVIGMAHFRHKTQKPVFKLNYLFAAIHLIVFACIAVFFL